jgi:hypothetical protein
MGKAGEARLSGGGGIHERRRHGEVFLNLKLKT